MTRYFLAAALLCLPSIAYARCDNPDVMRPCQTNLQGKLAGSTMLIFSASFEVEKINMRRRQVSAEPFSRRQEKHTQREARRAVVSIGFENEQKEPSVYRYRRNNKGLQDVTGGFGYIDSISRPARYVAGRLICAINVNIALAERGIRGTGSALAKSFLRWGRSTSPTPGAVAVYGRRGGGHVAIVSRVENGRVFVWNPSSRGRGWREVEYRKRAIDYRIAG